MLEITYRNPFVSSSLHIMHVAVDRLSLYAFDLLIAPSIQWAISGSFSMATKYASSRNYVLCLFPHPFHEVPSILAFRSTLIVDAVST